MWSDIILTCHKQPMDRVFENKEKAVFVCMKCGFVATQHTLNEEPITPYKGDN